MKRDYVAVMEDGTEIKYESGTQEQQQGKH